MRELQYQIERACTVVQALRKRGFTSGQLQKLRGELGLITANSKPVTMRAPLAVGDVVTVRVPERGGTDVPAVEIPLSVTYEDEDVLVLNKQPGLAVQPSRAHYQKSLFSALKFRYGESFVPHVVTRLDRDTSGLMLIAKNSLAHAMLYGKTVARSYLALVCNVPQPSEGAINAPIAKCATGMKRCVAAAGKHAVTGYKTLRRYENGAALLLLKPLTGRTHQIRVHLASIGCPIAGDRLYGTAETAALYPRQALHSYTLAFTHPITGERLEFCSPYEFE